MEVDTGAEVSVLPAAAWKSLFPDILPVKTSATLQTYTGESIPVPGEISVQIQYDTQSAQTNLVVVSTDGPALMGRDLLRKIRVCHGEPW